MSIVMAIFFTSHALAQDLGEKATAKLSQAGELVDVLRAAITASEPPSVFELVGRDEAIVEYDWGLDSRETSDFRLQLDRENESLRWGLKVKKESFANPESDDPKPKQAAGSLSYVGVSIDGPKLTRYSAGTSGADTARFASFEEALRAVQIPTPQFFGVATYGLFKAGAKEMRRIEPLIMDPKTKVQVLPTDDRLRYIARIDENDEKKQFLVYSWEFRLPDYVPVMLTVDQGLRGELTRIRSQRLFWEQSPSGIFRPFRIAAENPTIKRKPSGGFEFGHKSVDVELVWLEPQQINKMSFTSLTDIEKYLEIGEAIAKQRIVKPQSTKIDRGAR